MRCRFKKAEKELRRGSRLNVEHKNIEGLLHTEVETSQDNWEDLVKVVSLKDVSKSGLQVETDQIEEVDFIGTLVFTLKVGDGDANFVAIDAKHTWTRSHDDKLVMGFEYRNQEDDEVKTLMNVATN